MRKINLLVFPCGTEISLEIHRSLKDIPFITLFGASSVADHGKYVYKHYICGLPFVAEKNFLDEINKVIEENEIHYIFPAHDSAGLFLSENREKLKAKLLISPPKAVEVCRDKLKTYHFFENEDFIPQYWTSPDKIQNYPVFIKPAVGQGSQGAKKIMSQDELLRCLDTRGEQQVICEYLEGEEYTIDCFTDRFCQLRYIAFRTRSRVRNGISVHSDLLPLPAEVSRIAERVNELLPMRGVWFFQVKKDHDGRYKLLEIAVRVAGTMCVDRAAGVNLPLLTVFDAMGYDVEIRQQFPTLSVDRALYNCFHLPRNFDCIYVDYDDTIIIKGKVNVVLMAFLYQMINKGLPIILVTKHQGDIYRSLTDYRIADNIFEKIILVPPEKEKTDFFVPSSESLYIDDSFSERKKVEERYNITALGSDAVEAIIDWRQ